jgi:hypothetical protein
MKLNRIFSRERRSDIKKYQCCQRMLPPFCSPPFMARYPDGFSSYLHPEKTDETLENESAFFSAFKGKIANRKE